MCRTKTSEDKLTGAVTVMRCSRCGCESIEFSSSNKARHWAYKEGWMKIGTKFICNMCMRKLGLRRRYSVEEMPDIC